MPDSSFADMMRRLEAGDPEAAAVVYARYCHRLVRLARGKLGGALRAKVDADDVVHSVFRTFFRRAAQGQFDLDGADALWALLAEITLRKCGRWHRHFAARKRGGGLAAVPIDEIEPGHEPADSREPSPADATELLELLERLLRDLGEPERLVCEMRLQGFDVAEIADRAGCSAATVYRKLDLIKSRLRRLVPPEEEAEG
jgi:RNA polymerase sigma-70 factor (ECF subfamily)